ncbi:hypothetical protein T439DRAFT_321230 [Meredithblackwellia eburnea MCA 4105]
MADTSTSTSSNVPTRSLSQTKPKSILKNSSTPRTHPGVVWDEQNLAINDLAKDSTMKIDEPKTPWVNYNPETDQVIDLDKIPGFNLGPIDSSLQPPSSPQSNGGQSSLPSSRRGSEASEKMVKVETPTGARSSGEEDSEDDELQDEETIAHRKQFADKRGGHYRNEAEAMKRAQAMLADEEESSGSGEPNSNSMDAEEGEEEEEEDEEEGKRSGGIPPVPALPTGFRVNGA